MNAAARLIESLKIRPSGPACFDSMIESLLAAAAEQTVSYVIEHTTAPTSVTARVGSDACNDGDRGLLRLFRTMLARMAYMLAQESGTGFDPYGGDLIARRNGTVLAIPFKNTTVEQGLAIARDHLEARTELSSTPSWQHTITERSLSQPLACES